ncbi:uncharacterized protein TNCV_351081 [Trichonephila clavipes]|nr:uncharacterized protein TNCV_351081 [Trichonephila clavipes]
MASVLLAPFHDEFRGPRSDYVRQVPDPDVAAVAECYRYRIVACPVTSSSPVPLKTSRVGQRCTLNLSRGETCSRWCSVVVRRGGASSGLPRVSAKIHDQIGDGGSIADPYPWDMKERCLSVGE